MVLKFKTLPMKNITITRHYPVIFFAAMLLMTSCAPKIPFTQKIREQYKLTNEELSSIQFYASADIVLTRADKAPKEKGTEEGTLIVKSGKSVDEVVIRAGTPGVVEKVVDKHKLAISFEIGDNMFLVFGDTKDRKGPYTMLAADWNNKRGKLQYGGKTYYTSTSAANVYLHFKMKRFNQIKRNQRVVGGRKL